MDCPECSVPLNERDSPVEVRITEENKDELAVKRYRTYRCPDCDRAYFATESVRFYDRL